jgi:hypothetical protein
MSADRSKLYWALLTHAEQVSAIRRMAASRMSAETISGATGLSVEAIAAILQEPAPIPTGPPECEGCGE